VWKAEAMLLQRSVESVLFQGRKLAGETNAEKLERFARELAKEHARRRQQQQQAVEQASTDGDVPPPPAVVVPPAAATGGSTEAAEPPEAPPPPRRRRPRIAKSVLE